MVNKQRYLLVVSGPSGVGKDSVVQEMIERYGHALPGGIEVSVSATTRPKGPGEVEDVDYHYFSRQEFEEKVAAGAFWEWAEYNGNYYGTLKTEVDGRIEKGTTCVLVIEVQGAANAKKLYPDCTTVFILPPSLEVLEKRIRGRGRESEEQVQRRIKVAKEVEIPLASTYDFCVVNHDLVSCAKELYEILCRRQQAERECF